MKYFIVMTISLLISILLQIGVINSFADLDEAKMDHYISEIGTSESVIIDDINVY